jgi:hypothetical protein
MTESPARASPRCRVSKSAGVDTAQAVLEKRRREADAPLNRDGDQNPCLERRAVTTTPGFMRLIASTPRAAGGPADPADSVASAQDIPARIEISNSANLSFASARC